VWDNHNSNEYLPDPDAAIIVKYDEPATELAQDIVKQLDIYNSNDTAFQSFLFNGRNEDSRRLLFANNVPINRICENNTSIYLWDCSHCV